MLEEYIVTPDVFLSDSYQEPGACGVSLRWFKDAILEDGLIRDLRDGGWSRFCAALGEGRHISTKEILSKLHSGKRLRPFPPQLDDEPATTSDWLKEGLRSHLVHPVAGIVTAHSTARPAQDAPMATIERVTGAAWWRARSPSRDLARSTADYLTALDPILRHSNSLMFVDPNLDPSRPNYGRFADLLLPLRDRSTHPLIEIHRSEALGDGPGRTFPGEDGWRRRFEPLHVELAAAGLKATVSFWVDFHDRFLVSDLIGVSVSAGFDTTTNPNELATWTRLGREGRDEKQRRFDTSVRTREFRYGFAIGRDA